jgi:glutathione synthase/RimK-type ligase-like ATP-grasp enzyme
MRLEESETFRLASEGKEFSVAEIRSVYFRRPVPPAVGGDAAPHVRAWMASEIRSAWGGLLNTSPTTRWVNHPLAVSGASYKPEQLARARRTALRIPPTLLTTKPTSALEFCERHDWRVIVKPVAHGEILAESEADDRLVYTNQVSEDLKQQLDRVASCPTLFQRRLDKATDVRVTIAGHTVVAVELHSQEREFSTIDCRRENMRDMRYSIVELPPEIRAQLLALTQSYGLVFAAIDLVRDVNGTWWFLELNPAGQWAWLDERAGTNIADALLDVLISE